MKNFWILLSLLCAASTVWAIPTSITYQGALRQKGQPATGTHTVGFSVLDQGQVVWAMPTPMSVQVTNGLFSVSFTPSIADWSVLKAPSLRVFIDGEQLGNGNDEPINATVYALVSQSVADGAITNQKLAAPVQDHLVPTGAIMLFTTNCPAGWTRFAAMDSRFPIGSPSYGVYGGNSVLPLVAGSGSVQFFGVPTVGTPYHLDGSNFLMPPFLSMVYCQKN